MSTGKPSGFCVGRSLAYTLGIVRFNVLMLIAGAALLLTGQGQDILVALVEDIGAAEAVVGQASVFLLATFFWAFSIWLWARTLLDVDFGNAPDCPSWLPFWRAHVPRVLGVLAFAAVAWALWLTGDAVTDNLRFTVVALTVFTLVLGVVFYLFVFYRRPLARRLAARIGPGAVSDRLHVEDLQPGAEFPVKDFWHLFTGPRGTFVALSALIGTVLFFWAWIDPVQVSRNTYVIVLVLVWAGTWLPLGSFVTYFANRTGVPALALLISGAVAFSAWNDNHEIAHLAVAEDAGSPIRLPAARPNVVAAANDWLAAQPPSSDPAPMVVVATAGGGVRAAYWTATVLGTLHEGAQSRGIDVGDHLFAVSGVSGGSVGAAVYRATVLAEQARSDALPCGAVLDCTQAVLSQDLLGPAAAALLYPDLAQRFWPWPVPSADRGRALERGFETSFQEVTGSTLLADSLIGLNDATGRSWPALLLNATWVSNGRRLVASNLQLDAGLDASGHVGGAARGDGIGIDQLNVIGRDIALSTAAHNSARFPGVSPAGMWRDADGNVSGRLVDGGYFENFGADTARDLLERIKAATGPEFAQRVRPIVIGISSDPALPDDPSELVRSDPLHWGYEVRSILRGMFRTRNARGTEAFSALRRWTAENGGHFVHLRMCEAAGRERNPPLGWVLSRSAQQRINGYLVADGGTSCATDNAARLQSVLNDLARSRATTR
jgi:hypothetical protein